MKRNQNSRLRKATCSIYYAVLTRHSHLVTVIWLHYHQNRLLWRNYLQKTMCFERNGDLLPQNAIYRKSRFTWNTRKLSLSYSVTGIQGSLSTRTIIIYVLTERETDIHSYFMAAQDLGDESSTGTAQKFWIYLVMPKKIQFIEFVPPCEVVVATSC